LKETPLIGTYLIAPFAEDAALADINEQKQRLPINAPQVNDLIMLASGFEVMFFIMLILLIEN
jgi:hypothetical protein